ncbi:transporter [Rhodonellum psychrophilum GCM71 = DSM 17998]|uniref:Transporter n=2 Tax=Rhodonellum TaxID=336827 RepID=U5C5Z5_9BACT|nr:MULTISPECIES: TolC family protein [Rhodonellum]ERM83637.1 transporter [Rhodonellum psychrophilum GCM71 = DSM 17998]MDO9552436.1 TolC family protein [Rhodonellum sp.]SDY50380.1 Outer membrane protein TolC [Rhodonellum ikkaensis]
MKKTILFLALLIQGGQMLMAQETEVLDLEKAVQIGLEKNYDVKIAINNAALAEIEKKIGFGTFFLPVVNALYTHNYSKEDVEQQFATNPEPNQILGAKSDTENFTIAGIYGFNPESIVSIRRLGKLAEISELDAKIAIENTVAGISSAYYRLVLELQRNDVLQKTLELSKSRLDIAQARYELGGAGKRDFLTAQVDYNTDLSLTVSQEQIIQNARINLNELLAITPDREFMVKDTILIQEHLLLEDLLENAYTNNKLFLVTQRLENVAFLQLKEFQAQRLPSINLTGNYINNTFNSEAGFLLQNQRQGYNYGVNVNLNLFSGFTLNRRIQGAKVQKQNAEHALQQYEIQLNSDIYRAYNTYINNKNLLEIERKNYQVALESADIALERFRLGIANYLEFRDAQVNLLTAENRLITSIFNIKEQEIELMRLSGKIYFQDSYEEYNPSN